MPTVETTITVPLTERSAALRDVGKRMGEAVRQAGWDLLLGGLRGSADAGCGSVS
jgi:hypothetical protein